MGPPPPPDRICSADVYSLPLKLMGGFLVTKRRRNPLQAQVLSRSVGVVTREARGGEDPHLPLGVCSTFPRAPVTFAVSLDCSAYKPLFYAFSQISNERRRLFASLLFFGIEDGAP